MADDMLHDCIEFARSKIEGVKDWRSEGDGIVLAIKEALDAKYLPQWHVAVGKHFGSKITHDAKHFVSFYLGDCAFGDDGSTLAQHPTTATLLRIKRL